MSMIISKKLCTILACGKMTYSRDRASVYTLTKHVMLACGGTDSEKDMVYLPVPMVKSRRASGPMAGFCKLKGDEFF